jgi:hypothetical protein
MIIEDKVIIDLIKINTKNQAIIANISINSKKESSKYNMLFVQSYKQGEEDGLLE